MTAVAGTTVVHRRYVPYSHAHYAGNLVDGAYSLGLFGDVATEMCIRTDGDEGLFASYSDVQFLQPVRAGRRPRDHLHADPGRDPSPHPGPHRPRGRQGSGDRAAARRRAGARRAAAGHLGHGHRRGPAALVLIGFGTIQVD